MKEEKKDRKKWELLEMLFSSFTMHRFHGFQIPLFRVFFGVSRILRSISFDHPCFAITGRSLFIFGSQELYRKMTRKKLFSRFRLMK